MSVATSPPKHVAVVGSINHDYVSGAGVHAYSAWGGILFNVAALLRHGRCNHHIWPVAFLGTDGQKPIRRWLIGDERVRTDGLINLNRRGNLCRLTYRTDAERDERLLYRVPPLRFPHLQPVLASDVTLINYISGCDIEIKALEAFRTSYRGMIVIDVHSLLLGRRADCSRYARRPAHWLRVLRCADILQVNEQEFTTLSRCPPEMANILAWARAVLTPLPCRALVVTRGARGSVVVFRHGRGWRTAEFRAARRSRKIDPTGAGDTFSGAWIAHWLKSSSVPDATQYATRVAANPARPVI